MRFLRLCLYFTVLAMLSGKLFAQAGATGTILGTVTDTTGAIVSNAKVTVTNTATNSEFRTTTGSSGDYNAPDLNPGPYKVTVEAPGFTKSVTSGIVLTVNQRARVDAALKPGAVSETVETSAQAVTLNTDSAELANLVSQQQVEELPLNGRNFMQLLLVGAGAVTVGGEQGTMRQGEGNAISVNGGRPEGNNYTLDGLANTDAALVTPAVMLSQDAIQEFKVSSGTYPADLGFSATQVNIVSKGGTNTPHGSAFWFHRENGFDAKPFPTATNLNSGTATSNPPLHQNQFGFVFGGPVYIPKLYDGRNKSFFMANYEGWRITNGYTQQATMPNPAILGGDFSAETYLGNSVQRPDKTYLPGGPLPAYGTADCTALLNNGWNCMPVDPQTGQPFPGNVIPGARQTGNVGAMAVKNGFWSAPTLANQPEGTPNLFKNFGFPLHQNQQTYRGDQNLGKFGSAFFRYTDANYTNQGHYNSEDLVHGYEIYLQKQTSWAVSHTVNFGQSMVNNFRFGHLTANAPQGGPQITPDAVSQLALTGVFTKFSALQQTWPSVGLSKFNSVGGNGNSYTGSEGPTWEYADSFSWIKGRHTLGFGADYRKWHLIRNLDDDFYGEWSFGSSTIQNNSNGCTTPTELCGTGNAVADMLLGYYSGAGGFVPGADQYKPANTAGNPQDHVFGYFAPYAMDNWKLTQKLTVDIGVRWDYRAAAYEAKNHFFWLDTQNANGGLCYADKTLTSNGVAPGGDATSGPILRYCGKVPHEGQKTPFAPRLGITYRLTPKTVLRGGYGIFFDSAEGREIDNSGDIYPYSVRNSLNPTTNTTVPKLSNNMFPSYATLGPFPASTLTFLAVIESENPLNPYVQSWTGGIQRELARNTTLDVNYIGTHAVHLLDRHQIAQPYAIAADLLSTCQKTNANGVYYNIFGDPKTGQQAIDGCSIASRRPYKNFVQFFIDSDWHGYSHYNGLNVKLEHRAHELAATAVYTWSQSKDDKSAAAGVGATGSGYQGFMDNHRPQLDYGLSDFDVNQRFVASYIYQLPVGRGKKIGSGMNRAANLIVGGWETTGIATFQAGFPFSWSANDIQGVNFTQNQRANYTAGCNLHANLTKPMQRINNACFTQPDIGTYGNSKRSFLRQPGLNNWDMGLAKTFSITERVGFKLNGDFFNAWNHHQYAGNTGALIGSGSGGNSQIDNGISSATAGQITGTASDARIIQISGKFTF